MKTNMQGKTCLVTGATSGIGKATARGLAEQGAEVLVVSRNQDKCRRTAAEIKTETGNPAVDFLTADLSSQADIRALAETVQQNYSKLDVLINNAGGLFWDRRESVDGIEMSLALNHLNYYLLTVLLLDLLEESSPARIINVSSRAHVGQQLDFHDLQNQKRYRAFTAYGQSKLANLYFTYELDRRLEDSGVTVNAVHPGFVATNFAQQGWLSRLLMPAVNLFGKTSAQGADTVLYLATSPEVEGTSGKYFVDRKMVSSSKASYNREAARELWTRSAELTGLTG